MMPSLAQLQEFALAHAQGILLGLTGGTALALIAIALWRHLNSSRNELLLLIERIDLALGTKSAGTHEAAAALEEYVELSGKLVAQLRARNAAQPVPPAARSGAGGGSGAPELNHAIESVGQLIERVPYARAPDWADFRGAVKLDGGLTAARDALDRLHGQPLRNDLVDEAVRDGAFDLPLSLPPLLQRFFPDLLDDGIGRIAQDVEKAVQDLLACFGISIERVDPLAYVDAKDPRIDPLGDWRGLRRVPAIRSRVANASEAAIDNRKALVIGCHEPGFWRGDHALRAMKIAVFKRAEWAAPLSASQEV